MKVVVLGGAGDMGSRAARELGRSPEVELLTIADRNLEKAKQVAASIGPRAQARAVDARDHNALVRLIAEHDVAAGAIGPFYLFEARVARAAIDAGKPYVSICDDYDAAQAVLELDPHARNRGVTILTGLGWTPGLSNVLARKGVTMLDSAREVHIAWCGASSDSEGYAVVLHTMHIFTGQVPTFSGGKMTQVRAGTGRKVVTFPEPIGPVAVYHVGHPEPVTIPRFIPGLQEVTLRGGLTESFLNWVAVAVARLGLTATPARKDALGRIIKPLLPMMEKVGKPARPLSGIHVEVRGEKDGIPARVKLAAVDRMMNLTGVPLAIGTLMVGRRQINRPGVIAPEAEGAVPPDLFLEELAARGITVHTGPVEPIR
ncbi:MAG: saccharopine dehydrogenase NADP-binding domain-containing protein [Bacillota bacterium]